MCIICGSKELKNSLFGGYHYEGVDYHIARCQKCGLMFLNPLPTPEVLDGIYKNDEYFAEYYIQGSDRLGYLEGNYQDTCSHEGAVNLLKKHRTRGRLLDIGCAAGGFLMQAEGTGFESYGIEPNPKMAEEAGKNTKAEIKCTNFKPGIFPENYFDVVHMGDVLEHIYEPVDTLKSVSVILKDNGLLLLEQPLTYNNSLFNLFLASNMFFKKNRLSEGFPAHLWEFRPDTMRRFLEQNGFEVSFSRVFENKAKPLFVYKTARPKNKISRWLKNLSAFISSLPLLKRFELGDRMILVCRKKVFSNKPRLLFLHPTLGVGGAEQNRLSVLKYINKQKYDITLCCLGRKGKIGEEIESLGFFVDSLGVSDRSFNLFTTFSLYKYIKKNNFQLVHTCLSNTNLHGRIAARLAGVPVIIGEEQSEYERYNQRLGFIFKPLNRFLAKFTDKIITCSDKTKEAIAKEESIQLDKFLTIHNVIDTGNFSSVCNRKELVAELGLTDKDIIIGYVATLTKRKGHIYLLEAFKKLSGSFPELKLVLVGNGALKAELKSWVSKNNLKDKVIFAGERRDIADILSVFSVFVSPAMFEAFGIVLIEAMYMRLPCVAFRVGGIPEVIQDGHNGLLVNPGDSNALALTIERLLKDSNLAKSLGENGRRRVEENFSADKYASALENLYDDLLRRRGIYV